MKSTDCPDSINEISPRFKELSAMLKFPEVQSWRALLSAFSTILAQLEKGLQSDDCSVSRFQILFYLYFEGHLPAVTIARKLYVTRGNISMFLRRLESDGLIKPMLAKGQKRPTFCLTRKGVQFFERIFPPHISRVRRLAPALGQDTIKTLTAIKNLSAKS